MRSTMEEGWQLKIEATNSSKKEPIEPIQMPAVEKLQLIAWTDPVGERKSEKLEEKTHRGLQVNQKRPEGPKETRVPTLPNKCSAGRVDATKRNPP